MRDRCFINTKNFKTYWETKQYLCNQKRQFMFSYISNLNIVFCYLSSQTCIIIISPTNPTMELKNNPYPQGVWFSEYITPNNEIRSYHRHPMSYCKSYCHTLFRVTQCAKTSGDRLLHSITSRTPTPPPLRLGMVLFKIQICWEARLKHFSKWRYFGYFMRYR